jgi:lipopolysaccharide heptosyltransferase II
VPELQIPIPRERRLVKLADAAIGSLQWLPAVGRRRARNPIQRVLLLRLERIGDLLMTLAAIEDARAAWPHAEIDLAVGSWNRALANLIPGLARVHTADAPWLARETATSWYTLLKQVRRWRARRYDIVINFEPDIRSNFIAWRTRAPIRIGYWTGGGGGLLTDVYAYVPTTHAGMNARRLIADAAGLPAPLEVLRRRSQRRLTPPEEAERRARDLLQNRPGPFIAVHSGGGRLSKQWYVDRFAETTRALAKTYGATMVLTGSDGDRPIVKQVRRLIADEVAVVDVAGVLDVPALAALLGRMDLLVTGDTGPMHLAAAMGTPIVALFGPSDPRRYGPNTPESRVVRVTLPCSPCGRVRLPPERCRGHVPDCMDGITVDMVLSAAAELLGPPIVPTMAKRPAAALL